MSEAIRPQFARRPASAPDRRERPRLKRELSGRFMTHDGREFPCVTIDISASGFSLRADVRPVAGEPVVAYLDQIGRVEGCVVRVTDEGFAFEVKGEQRIQKLADKIAWLRPDERPERRTETRESVPGEAILRGRDGGGEQRVKILNISPNGVSFRAEGIARGERIVIDGRKAVVLRVFAGGAAASFI